MRVPKKKIALLAMCWSLVSSPVGAAEIFADGFDAGDLSAKWEIVRPDGGAMAVEKGELLLLSSTFQSMAKEENANIFMPKVDLPQGDWTLSLVFSAEFRTAREELRFGVTGAKLGEDDVWAAVGSRGDKYGGWAVTASAGQTKPSRQTSFVRDVISLGCNVCGENRMFPDFVKMVPQPIEANFAKRGQQYTLSVKLGPDGEWVTLERITAINVKGRPFLLLRQKEAAGGETLVRIDSVKIESAE